MAEELLDFDSEEPAPPFEVLASAPQRTPAPPRRAPASKRTATPEIESRELPHSLEAEAGLLGCILVDGPTVLDLCSERGIRPDSFFSPSHRVIFEGMLSLHARKQPIDLIILCDELKKTSTLDSAGGPAAIVGLTSTVATTAHVAQFVAIVFEAARKRRLVRRLTLEVERLFDHGVEADEITTSLREVADQETAGIGEDLSRPLVNFEFLAEDPNILLGTRYRYIGRGGMLQIIAMAGSGKSSGCYQSAAMWSVGRSFLGIDCIRPLKVFIAQTEDDDGDVGEVVESIKQGCEWNAADVAAFLKNVRVDRPRGLSGETFIRWLAAQCRRHQPDLVVINPLSNVVGDDLADSRVAHEFCNSLDRINPKNQWAYVVWHHTPKPATGSDAKNGPKNNLVWQYGGFGSSVWANRPRATIIIEPRDESGTKFWWHLAKRGRRAGVTKLVPHGAVQREEIITKIPTRHSSRRIEVNGKSYPMILWEMDDETPEPTPTGAEGAKRTKAVPFSDSEVLAYFPKGKDAAAAIGVIYRDIRAKLGPIREAVFYEHYRRKLIDDGRIVHDPQSGRYYRP